MLTVILYTGLHAILELSDHSDKFVRAAKFGHDLPESVSADGIKRLCQIYEGSVEIQVLPAVVS